MASIESLLNPLPELAVRTPRFGAQYTLTSISTARNMISGNNKSLGKQKVPKDAPVFKENKPQGEVRYPPCEERHEGLKEEHIRFKLFPMRENGNGNIGNYARTIPYKSEKKSFEEKTGRSKFEGM